MKRFVFSLLALLPILVYGQKARIEFPETSHHFGVIAEENGNVSYDFRFRNTGKSPLILTDVRAGCGCTVPAWSRAPVLPGGEGTIRVTFDPRQRPGAFIKSITVNSNAENPVVSLTIRGKVTTKRNDSGGGYPHEFGKVRASADFLDLGVVRNTETVHGEIEIVNMDSGPASLRIESPFPYIGAEVVPAVLKKGEKGVIRISYDAGLVGDWGVVSSPVTVEINGDSRYELKVIADIQEDFSRYGGNFESAPRIGLSETETTLVKLLPDSSYTHDVVIRNDGKSELVIRKIKTSNPAVTVNLSRNTVRPDRKVNAGIRFKTTAPEAVHLIQFITNDPVRPVITYKLSVSTKP